jgi:ATP-dependent RNA helicase DeaD
VLPIYGGQAMGQQLRTLKRGVDVVVATPGRALDHIRRRTLELKHVRTVVLDEADEMLDMGFAEELDAILEQTPGDRQTALFSATMPSRIAAIAHRHLKNPVEIKIAREPVRAGAIPRVRQTAFIVARPHKVAALGRVLDMENPASALVFCRTRTEVDELTDVLKGRGYRAEAIHGGMTQVQRDRVMNAFRAGKTELLVATDVAARGLDIPHISHVINYDVPSAPEAYVHRIGRTGRAGREGTAVTMAEPHEHRLLRNIEQLTKCKIEMATVPTVADLRAKRLELTRASIYETLSAGDLDRFRVVVESLGQEFDVMEIAAAAVKLAYESSDQEGDEGEIPAIQPLADRMRPQRGRFEAIHGAHATGERTHKGRAGAAPTHATTPWNVAKLYIAAGRNAGIRPSDLVGAIANETGLEARAIGAIEVADQFSLVEVPEEASARIIEVLSRTRIKGHKMAVRLFRQ